MLPRIRGRVGTGDDGKFYYEVSIWDFYGENQVGDHFTLGPFDDEEKANEAGREAVKIACDVAGGDKETYMDMKNGGMLRPWKSQ